MTKAPEPEDKLDATTIVAANGPEDATFDWHAIDWRVEDDVRWLRQRIFTASKAGDLTKVRSLVAVGTALYRVMARAAPLHRSQRALLTRIFRLTGRAPGVRGAVLSG
jgi:hypothetical protein